MTVDLNQYSDLVIWESRFRYHTFEILSVGRASEILGCNNKYFRAGIGGFIHLVNTLNDCTGFFELQEPFNLTIPIRDAYI
jgi:hypothetical protein